MFFQGALKENPLVQGDILYQPQSYFSLVLFKLFVGKQLTKKNTFENKILQERCIVSASTSRSSWTTKEKRDKRNDETTTKYNAKANQNDLSINESLHSGPSLLSKIFDILVRFTSYKYIIPGDIQSAFLNIRVEEEDRDFLWLKDIDQKNFELVSKRFTSVSFSLTCSLSLLSMTVSHHVLKYLDINENLVIKFLNDLYMDDSISGCVCSEKYFRFYLWMKTVVKEGNFNLHKRISNCAEMTGKINSFEEQEFGEKIVHLDHFHKVLGIFWHF